MPGCGRCAGIAAILAIACILPIAVSGYRVSQFSQVLIYAIAMLGLNILTGFNGQISLGQGAFYGIGACTTAILLDKTAIPYWATVPIAVRSVWVQVSCSDYRRGSSKVCTKRYEI